MGNRGCLHDSSEQITKPWARKAWVTCLLEFKGRHRQVMAPNKYTELFFLDEVTALAAGHRPCGTCQKSRYDIFKQLWFNANRKILDTGESAIQAIDEHLHEERYASSTLQGDRKSKLSDLPYGVFIVRKSDPSNAWLYWEGKLFLWNPEGYTQQDTPTQGEVVTLITPQSIVRTLKEGFWPKVHSSVKNATNKKVSLHIGKNVKADRNHRTEDQETAGKIPNSNLAPDQKASIRDQKAQPKDSYKLYRLKTTPSGKELFTYFAAILRVTGMDKGAVFPLKKFLSNFSTHLNSGRIEKASGGYRLTAQGMDYFAARYRPGNRQHVKEYEVQTMMRLMQNGGRGWEPIN